MSPSVRFHTMAKDGPWRRQRERPRGPCLAFFPDHREAPCRIARQASCGPSDVTRARRAISGAFIGSSMVSARRRAVLMRSRSNPLRRASWQPAMRFESVRQSRLRTCASKCLSQRAFWTLLDEALSGGPARTGCRLPVSLLRNGFSALAPTVLHAVFNTVQHDLMDEPHNPSRTQPRDNLALPKSLPDDEVWHLGDYAYRCHPKRTSETSAGCMRASTSWRVT